MENVFGQTTCCAKPNSLCGQSPWQSCCAPNQACSQSISSPYSGTCCSPGQVVCSSTCCSGACTSFGVCCPSPQQVCPTGQGNTSVCCAAGDCGPGGCCTKSLGYHICGSPPGQQSCCNSSSQCYGNNNAQCCWGNPYAGGTQCCSDQWGVGNSAVCNGTCCPPDPNLPFPFTQPQCSGPKHNQCCSGLVCGTTCCGTGGCSGPNRDQCCNGNVGPAPDYECCQGGTWILVGTGLFCCQGTPCTTPTITNGEASFNYQTTQSLCCNPAQAVCQFLAPSCCPNAQACPNHQDCCGGGTVCPPKNQTGCRQFI